jgi:AcrR family transcriptional regulator
MSPRTKQQFEKIRKSSKDKILAVALELFAQNGYQGTSIAQIAKKAKISKGLMYNYFKNKEKLLEEIVLDGFSKIAELDYGLDSNENPKKKLKYLIDSTLNHLYENLEYWQLYTALLVQPNVQKKFEKKFYEFRESFIASLAAIFKGLGSDDPELDAFLLGMHFDGLAINFVAAPDDFPMEDIRIALYNHYCKLKRKKKK